MKSLCLWKSMTDELAAKIKSGAFKRGETFFTLDQLSSTYGVSKITSRRVLDELARMNMIDKGRGRAPSVKRGFVPEELVIFGCGDKRDVARGFSPILAKLYEGAVEECARQGCEPRPVSASYFESRLDCERLVVLILQNTPEDQKLRDLFKSGKFRVACAHALSPEKGIATVRGDFKKGALLAMESLLGKGHSRIAFVRKKRSGPWVASRFDGYYEALKSRGILLDMDLVKECDIADFADVERCLDSMLALGAPPTALFCANDETALLFLKACERRRLAVPKRLAIAGFDNIPEGELSNPPLSSVDTKLKLIGATAARTALEMSPGDTMDILVEPEFVPRKSA